MKTDPRHLAIYIGFIALPAVIIVVLLLKLVPKDNDDAPVLPGVGQAQAARDVQPEPAPASMVSDAPLAESKKEDAGVVQPVATIKPDAKKSVEGKTDSKSASNQVKTAQTKAIKSNAKNAPAASTTEAYVSIACKEGTQIFVDGVEKGKVTPTGLTVTVSPGVHKVFVTSKSGALHTQNVEMGPGKTVKIKPSFCN